MTLSTIVYPQNLIAQAMSVLETQIPVTLKQSGARKERAVHLAELDAVQPKGGDWCSNFYWVKSEFSDTRYLVDISRYGPQCSCPDWQRNRQQPCKHILAVSICRLIRVRFGFTPEVEQEIANYAPELAERDLIQELDDVARWLVMAPDYMEVPA